MPKYIRDRISGILLTSNTSSYFKLTQRALVAWVCIVSAVFIIISLILFIIKECSEEDSPHRTPLESASGAMFGLAVDQIIMGVIVAYLVLPRAVGLIPELSDVLYRPVLRLEGKRQDLDEDLN
jgi:hypothetical protein